MVQTIQCILTLMVSGPPPSGISDAALRVIWLEPQKEARILSFDNCFVYVKHLPSEHLYIFFSGVIMLNTAKWFCHQDMTRTVFEFEW